MTLPTTAEFAAHAAAHYVDKTGGPAVGAWMVTDPDGNDWPALMYVRMIGDKPHVAGEKMWEILIESEAARYRWEPLSASGHPLPEKTDTEIAALAPEVKALFDMWDDLDKKDNVNQEDAYYALYRGKRRIWEAARAAAAAECPLCGRRRRKEATDAKPCKDAV